MCRFVMYMGPPLTLASLITEPVNSLINQSIHSREQAEPLNGDGFGVAWYAPRLSRFRRCSAPSRPPGTTPTSRASRA